MSEEKVTNQGEESTVENAWRDVGDQLENLGKSLASAFRSAWESEENRQHVQELQQGLESMVNQVHDAVKETAASPQAQKVQDELEKAVQSTRSALSQASAELQKSLDQLLHSGKKQDTP